ncbi:MAG: hypothetical protein Q8R98_16630 [Rubrivivax sp.]|nr:hypothetical protein [Rubrivivax sp.]MDP3613474.1 hypothetical protein [Rubrivivax sp.]
MPPTSMRARPALAAALMVWTLAGCIVVPQTHTVYDPGCQTHTRQVTLEAAYIGGFHSCAGDGCLALLATAGVVSAASVVVSGSLAVVGNVVYWLELQGRCNKPGPQKAVQIPTASAAATAASSTSTATDVSAAK